MRAGIRQSVAPWFATPVVAIPVALSLTSLGGLLEWGEWARTAALFGAGVVAAVTLTRIASRSRLLPTLVGLAVAFVGAVPLFARNDEGGRVLIPTPSAVRQLIDVAAAGIDDAATSVAPAPVTSGLLLLVLAGLVSLFLVVEHLAVSWRVTASAGLLLLVPWMPAIALGHTIRPAPLLAALGAWILLMALTRRPSGAGRQGAPLAGLAASAAALALVAVVAPAAVGGNGWGLVPRLTAPENVDLTTRLNLELDLRNSLTLNSASPVLVYATSGGKPEAFKLYSLAAFDGSAWSRDNEGAPDESITGVLWMSPTPDWSSRSLDRVSMQVLGLAETNLPLPPVPRSIDVGGDWAYSSLLDEVASPSATTQDLSYTFDADLTYFDAATLRSAGPADAEDALLDPRYVEIASAIDDVALRALAQQLTAEATTRYDKAVALQEYFRNDQLFTYDTSVVPTGNDSVSVFLDEKSGYCVQFATSMVMLARSLDIPARLAVGFLPGQADAAGGYIVRGGDAHAWPEIYFEGLGWVRFEPTPGTQTGLRPIYADPVGENPVEPSPTAEVPVVEPTASPTTSAPSFPTTEPTGGTATPGQDEASFDPVPWLAGGGVTVAAVVVAWALWRRRRATLDRAASVESAWEELRTRVDPSASWPLTLTPLEVPEAVGAALAADSTTLAHESTAALSRLAVAVSDARYAPEGTGLSGAEAHEVARKLVTDVAAAKAEATGRPVRGGGRGGPRRGA